MADGIVTREQAAKRLHCSMRTVERMLRDGRLGAVRRADGRLSVDADDLARVLADPGLLERRRVTSIPETPAASAAPEHTLPPKAAPASDARLTPLGAARDSAAPETQTIRTPLARRERPSLRLPTRVVVATLVLACLTASIALVYSHTQGGRNPTAPHAMPPTRHTPTEPAGPSRGGYAAATTSSRSPAESRGGRSLTLVMRAAAPQTSRPHQTHANPPPTGHTRGSSTTNCGFGSLTLAAC